MASYPTPIIQLPTQQPFNMMQNPMINAYFSAMMKNKFEDMADERKQKRREINYKNSADSLRKQYPDAEFEESVTSDGEITLKTKSPKEPSLTETLLGMAPEKTYEQYGKNMGVSRGTVPASQNPSAAMSLLNGGVGDVSAQPLADTQGTWRDAVIKGITSNPYSKAYQSKEKLDLSKEKVASSSIPDGFDVDFDSAVKESNDDPIEFINKLKGLASKYAGNKQALDIIQKHINIQQEQSDDAAAFNF